MSKAPESVFVYEGESAGPRKLYKSFSAFCQANPPKPVKNIPAGSMSKVEKITWQDDLMGMFLLLVWPGCLLWIWFPIIWVVQNFLFNPFSLSAIFYLGVLLYAVFAPVRYWKAGVDSWVNFLMMRYFSFKGIFEEALKPESNAYILVAPPHGVFPFGNILTLLFFHTYTGFHFRGAGASVLYRIPIMRHVMTWMGCIDAGWSTMQRTLNNGHSVGLSTGGIAELFESSTDSETIIIKNRKGSKRGKEERRTER
eukprot:TRINITY_DN2227_c0_g1_i2.p1 TRINITY_DN2227_c0_g1~~TRINITY_DN2227_c0_g1_i2.p1  ORF type:complete len:254 (-),score=50.40 TRINITY_DN2227_c0_g1_i2:450-1211(-)